MTKSEEIERLAEIVAAQEPGSYLADILAGLQETIGEAIRNDFCFADFRQVQRDLESDRIKLAQQREELKDVRGELQKAQYDLANVRRQLSQIREDAEHAARRVAAYR